MQAARFYHFPSPGCLAAPSSITSLHTEPGSWLQPPTVGARTSPAHCALPVAGPGSRDLLQNHDIVWLKNDTV